VTVNRPSRWLVVLAYAAIYLIWGSSYIGIHFAIQSLPPFLMTATRFLLAGGVVIVWARLRGTPWPTLIQWRTAIFTGFLLFVVNNGGIVWAEAHGLPTGVAAVLVATVPLWMVLLTWLRPGGVFPGTVVLGGLALGFVGIILLASPDHAALNLAGVAMVLVAAFAWAFGSLYAKDAPSASPTFSVGAQLLSGGVIQLVISLASGELPRFDVSQVTATSVVAMVYLAIVSSVIAYSAFVWLMKVSDPAKVATYAYVNPVVAVFLGWLLANEPLTPRTLASAGIIIASVVIINVYKGKGRKDSADALLAAEIEAAEAVP
jgi:drug/metabolite transporter (DMT)-like permease